VNIANGQTVIIKRRKETLVATLRFRKMRDSKKFECATFRRSSAGSSAKSASSPPANAEESEDVIPAKKRRLTEDSSCSTRSPLHVQHEICGLAKGLLNDGPSFEGRCIECCECGELERLLAHF